MQNNNKQKAKETLTHTHTAKEPVRDVHSVFINKMKPCVELHSTNRQPPSEIEAQENTVAIAKKSNNIKCMWRARSSILLELQKYYTQQHCAARERDQCAFVHAIGDRMALAAARSALTLFDSRSIETIQRDKFEWWIE